MKKYIILPILAVSCVSSHAASTQIAGTGWNADLIVETAGGAVADTDAARLAAGNDRTNANIEGWAFY